MRRWLGVVLLLVLAVAAPGSAIDPDRFDQALSGMAAGISRNAYGLSEREDSAERALVGTIDAQGEASARDLKLLISQIESKDELAAVARMVKTFGKKSPANALVAREANRWLAERSAFLGLEASATGESRDLDRIPLERRPAVSANPATLLTRQQRALLLVDVPVAEAALSFEDKRNERRQNLEEILRRHECRVISSYLDESAKPEMTNLYVSGKKFVLEALMRQFKGQVVNQDLCATLKLTAGGFFSPKELVVNLKPTAATGETGSLAWYQSVIEKDPFGYLLKTGNGNVESMGKIETLAGEKKLHVKNARLQIWVVPAKGTIRNAIYFNKVDFGDIYVSVQ